LKSLLKDKFICHLSNEDWGFSIMVMEKEGKAFARTYFLNDTKDSIYFDWLNVDENYREVGLATELLDAHIKSSDYFKLESMLWVEKHTWIEDWYMRKGYEYYSEYDEKSNWLIKNKNQE
jgi:N-acetylglutamate synthase-like GNAT family acetyltransferase